MNPDILNSVIEITQNRDLDSLEYSLVATLAEIIPVTQISIFKPYTNGKKKEIEEVLNLTVMEAGTSSQYYKWSDKPQAIDSDMLLEQCIYDEKATTQEHDGNLFRILLPISSDSTTFGAISLHGKEEILESMGLVKGFIKVFENYQIILNESEHDKLTGLFNRRTFDKKLGRLLKTQSERNHNENDSKHPEKRHGITAESSTWLVVLDFDGFKQINDTYGHIYGDEVLLILSQKMKQCFRKTDLLFRFGGDEFVIILEPIPLKEANDALERFRVAVSDHDFPQIGHITISTGFAKISEKDYPPAVLEKADKALYYAKEHGKNCIFNFETLVASGELKDTQTSGSIDLF